MFCGLRQVSSVPYKSGFGRRRVTFGSVCHFHQSVSHTHPFNGPLSRTTRVGRYQKGKTYQSVSQYLLNQCIEKSAPAPKQGGEKEFGGSSSNFL